MESVPNYGSSLSRFQIYHSIKCNQSLPPQL